MKGLLYKEWAILTGSYKQSVFFLAVVYGGIALLSGQTEMAYALGLVFSIMITSTVAFDENSHWDTYARTLPVTPAQIVSCKYLFGLGGLALGTAASVFIVLLSRFVPPLLVRHETAAPSVVETAAALLACSSMGLLLVALLLPLSYQFNSVKARSWMFLIVGVLAGCIGIIISVSPALMRVFTAPDEVILLGLAAVFAGMLAVYFLSYRVCIGIYKRKSY